MPEQLSASTEAGVSGADPALNWGARDLWATQGLQLGLELSDAGRRRSLWPSWFPPLWIIHPRRGGGRGTSAVSPESWRVLPWLFGTVVGACALVDFSSRCSFRVRLDFEGSCSRGGFSSVTAGRRPAPGQGLLCCPALAGLLPSTELPWGARSRGPAACIGDPLCRPPGPSRPRESGGEWPASEVVCWDKWVGTKMASASCRWNNSEPLSSQVE